MIRRPPRSTPLYSSAASDVYKRQGLILICALLDFDVAGSMRGTQSAVAPIAVLLAISGVALVQRWYLVAVWLLLVLTGFLLKLTAAENIWLYLFDPIALAIAAVFSWRHRYRLMGFALRPQLIQRSTIVFIAVFLICLLYTSPSPRDGLLSRMPSSA